MLVLSRKKNEKVFIGNGIEVTVLQIHGRRVRLGVSAPDHVQIQREEVRQRRQIPQPSTQQLEVLLVEDSLADARLAMQALTDTELPHRVTLVRDGEEALDFLRQAGRFARAPRPDLILLDLALPKLDGRQVLTEIKTDYGLKDIPVVVLTASDAEEDRILSNLLNADAFLRKPVNLFELCTVDKRLAVAGRDLAAVWRD